MSEEIPSEYNDLTQVSPEQNAYWQALAPEPEPQAIQPHAGEAVNNLPQQQVDSRIVPTQETQARFQYFAGGMEQMERRRLEYLRQQEWLRQRQEWLQQHAVEKPPRNLKDVLSHWKDIFKAKFTRKEQVHSSHTIFNVGAVGVGATWT